MATLVSVHLIHTYILLKSYKIQPYNKLVLSKIFLSEWNWFLEKCRKDWLNSYKCGNDCGLSWQISRIKIFVNSNKWLLLKLVLGWIVVNVSTNALVWNSNNNNNAVFQLLSINGSTK